MSYRALVTGGSGIVGRSIVERLLIEGWYVRVLCRNGDRVIDGVEVVSGDITDPVSMEYAVDGVDAVFHCAGEKYDESKMMDVNAKGTANVAVVAKKSGIRYFCHISSVSVYGANHAGKFDESCPTEPATIYGRSKLESEKLILSDIPCRDTCILRVGNVVSHLDFGVLRPVVVKGFGSFVRISVHGERNTHMVHADDVASAALYFFVQPLNAPCVFNVTYDDKEPATLKDAYAIWQDISRGRSRGYARQLLVLVNKIFGFMFRSLSARFSSARLQQYGFVFPLGFNGAIEDIYKRLQD